MTQHDESPGPSSEGLPRSFVPADERELILSAVADVVSIAGYRGLALDDLASRVGVPTETVRGYFEHEQSAFLAAYDAAVWQGMDKVLAAIAAADGFVDRIWAGWEAFVGFIVSEPAFAAMCIVEVLEAGPAGIERRNMTLRGLAALIEHIADDSLPPDRPHPPALYMDIVLGGITEIVRTYLADGRIAQLPEALPQMNYSLLLPYVGHDAALAECERRERARRNSA
jgi:AcrR family transcriptional regulator